MSRTLEQRDADNQKHLNDPQPGDYWHEMFSPDCVVIERLGKNIIFCCHTKDVGGNKWTWNLYHLSLLPLAEWQKRLVYPSMPNKTVCMVEPGPHLWAVEIAQGQRGGA